MSSTKVELLCIGNPLLDITTKVPKEFLDKYELKPGNAIIAEKKHMAIFDEAMADDNVAFCAGGSSMNTTRAAQWMLQTPSKTTFVGCMGKDTNAKTLLKAVTDAGVKPNLMESDAASTGKCAVLVTDKERSMVTYLGAAEHYDKEHLKSTSVQDALESAKIFYAEGFFLTHNKDSLIYLGKYASNHPGKKFMLNLSAPFLMEFFWESMAETLKYTHVVFCNETEAKAAGKRLGLEEDATIQQIAKALADYEVADPSIKRVAVITQGPDPVIVHYNGKTESYAPDKMEADKIEDTNGAGDSFVGGFIAEMLHGGDIPACIRSGNYCGSECLKHVGCRFSGVPTFHH